MILLSLTFTTATFAWVSKADTNRVDGIGLNASTNSNLEFSIDGVNWTSDMNLGSISGLIENLSFIDLSSVDGKNFTSRPDGSSDMIYPNINYFSIELFVRTTTRYHDVYLVNNISNQVNFDDTPNRGTFITSRGVTFRSSVDFQYDVDDYRLSGIPYVYYAKHAMRISMTELKTDNPNDLRSSEELSHFIFDPSENEHRGFGKSYGSISYHNAVRYDLIDIPSLIPNTTYSLTKFSNPNKYVPEDTTSRIMKLIETDEYNSTNDVYYKGKVLINIWLEGFDADAFDAIYNDDLKIRLEFQSAESIDI